MVSQAQMLAAESGSSITLTNEPLEAVSGANAIYTDVWASMGQESEAAQRSAVFHPYQVNEALMEVARDRGTSSCIVCPRIAARK